MKKIMLSLMFVLVLISLTSAADLGTFKKGECVELYQLCDTCSYVNLSSVKFPNGTILNVNSVMTKTEYDYNYTFCSTNDSGGYQYSVCGDKDSGFECEDITFTINPAGQLQTEGQGMLSLGLLFTYLALAFLFSLLAFKFLTAGDYSYLGLFFILLSLVFVVITIHTGYVYSRDLVYYDNSTNLQQKIFLTVTYSLIGMAFIGLTFFTFKVIQELKVRKSIINYGEGYNPQKKSY